MLLVKPYVVYDITRNHNMLYHKTVVAEHKNMNSLEDVQLSLRLSHSSKEQKCQLSGGT